MTAETLSAAAGIVLSLAAAYIPPFAPWFQGLDGAQKRLVMLGLLAAATLASFVFECSGWGTVVETAVAAKCTPPEAMEALRAFIAALVANQAAYQLEPCKSAVREADAWWQELDFFDDEL